MGSRKVGADASVGSPFLVSSARRFLKTRLMSANMFERGRVGSDSPALKKHDTVNDSSFAFDTMIDTH
ncbi:MAG: hypothetical protein ACJ741_21920 [Pyrinomonadaceae bacterium]